MKFILTGFSLLLSAATLHATAVTIVNPSFEADIALLQGAQNWSDVAPTGWTDPNGDSNDNFMELITGFASTGDVHLGFNAPTANRNYVSQDLGVAWLPNTRYSYTVALGNRSGFGQSATVLGLGSSTAVSGTFLSSQTIAPGSVAEGTFADFTHSFTTGAVAPAGNVTVYVENLVGGRTHVDNIRLDASPVPEVSSFGLIAAVLGLVSLRRRRSAA